MSTSLFYNAYIWNTDLTFTPNSWMLVENGTIKDIGNNDPPEANHKTDMHGQYLLPGFINCHTHIFGSPMNPEILSDASNLIAIAHNGFGNLNLLLKGGVTYFRDVGCPGNLDIQLADLLNTKKIFGPEALVSGAPLVMTGGHVHEIGVEVDGVDEVRKQARQLLKDKAGCLKIMATGGVSTDGETPHDVQLNEDEIRAAVEEAHHKNKTIAAHAQGLAGVKNALRAGVDSIEHGIYLDDEAIALFIEKDAYLVPTLMAPHAIVKYGTKAGIPAFMVHKAQEILDIHQENLYKAYQAGVKIAMGTDAGTPFNLFEDSFEEIILMEGTGMSPADAIDASTQVAAQLLQVDQTHGTLEKNKNADFVVLQDNPLDDITHIKNIQQVYKHGKACITAE